MDMFCSQPNKEIDKWVQRISEPKVTGELLAELGVGSSLWD